VKTLGIIPARYASTRFPGKPLAMILGKSMVERVYQQALLAETLADVIVATDDQRIFDHVTGFGGKAVMTSPKHPSGTDRCAEALTLTGGGYQLVVNIQGDEPFIHPGQIDLLVNTLASNEPGIGTLVKKITNTQELDNEHIPKVVCDNQGKALYFSRRAIPFCKPAERDAWISRGLFLRHIGIYGYRSELLPRLAALGQGRLEASESLEQLRWLENGFEIITALTDHENLAVDIPSDIHLVESKFRNRPPG
jgi:3-deoxy-manno-octulosonate cytidylyltransferase (CMP-KDO synthetase)